MSNFPSVQKYYSFELNYNGASYALIEVNKDIVDKFKNLIEKLETIPQVVLCTRGDSKNSLSEHNNLFEEDLSKIFIVGEKSQSNIKKTATDKYTHTHNNNNLIDELKVLISEVNKEITDKPKQHKIYGEINDEFINKLIFENDIDALGKWKIFFLSFLHNSGSLKNFKSSSPISINGLWI